jgi:hypothetical protein
MHASLFEFLVRMDIHSRFRSIRCNQDDLLRGNRDFRPMCMLTVVRPYKNEKLPYIYIYIYIYIYAQFICIDIPGHDMQP